MPLLDDDTIAFGEDLDTGRSKDSLTHPYVTFFHLAFRGASVIVYMLCGWFSDSFIASFVTVVLFLSMDFWTVKNITGRLMVGLRWWNYVDDDGKSHWVFESRKGSSQNRINEREARIFWTALILTPLVWGIFFIVALFGFKLKWLVDPVDKHLYKPFHCYGFDVMSAGSSYSRFGVIVGLPVNFTYNNVDMVDTSRIKVNEESVVWDSEDGQKLQKSLVLSENAQIYAIAKEIKYRQTQKPFIDTILATSSCLLPYSMGNYLNNKFNLYVKPRAVRYTIYGLIGLFVIGLYTMSKDVTQVYYEEKIDKELMEKNKIFAEGGKEYYNKMLNRNQALRKMLGKEGERLYSALGNENYLFRTKHIPVVQRKLFFEEFQKS